GAGDGQLRIVFGLLRQLRQGACRVLDPMAVDVEAGDVLVLEQPLLLFGQPVLDPHGRQLPGVKPFDISAFDDRFELRFVLHALSPACRRWTLMDVRCLSVPDVHRVPWSDSTRSTQNAPAATRPPCATGGEVTAGAL